jgi:hypothetical protein
MMTPQSFISQLSQMTLPQRPVVSLQQQLLDQQQLLQQKIQESIVRSLLYFIFYQKILYHFFFFLILDTLCRGQIAETVIPLDNGRRFVVCLDDSKGFEQQCPRGLVYHQESRRCERSMLSFSFLHFLF